MPSEHASDRATMPGEVQKSITKKIYIQELWFLHSAPHSMLIKFHEDILNGFQATEWTRVCDGRTTRPKTLKGTDIINSLVYQYIYMIRIKSN